MSKRNDRQRAKSGIGFRNDANGGNLVNIAEYKASHNTVKEAGKVVDDALKAEFADRKDRENQVVALVDGEVIQFGTEPYFCTKCQRTHSKGKVFLAHQEYEGEAE